MSKYLTKILQKCCCYTSSFIKDSKGFCNKLKDVTLEEGEMWVFFDASALFTYNPVQVALDVIHSRVHNSFSEEATFRHEFDGLVIEDFMVLLS